MGRESGSVLVLDNYFLTDIVVVGSLVVVLVGVVLVAVRMDGVGYVLSNLVCGLGDTLTEGVIGTVVVVISHITLVLLGGVDSSTSSLFYSNLSWVTGVDVVNLPPRGVGVVLGSEGLPCVTGGLRLVGVGA
jgi:hypothetical protein